MDHGLPGEGQLGHPEDAGSVPVKDREQSVGREREEQRYWHTRKCLTLLIIRIIKVLKVNG